jgi:hypothetical protein
MSSRLKDDKYLIIKQIKKYNINKISATILFGPVNFLLVYSHEIKYFHHSNKAIRSSVFINCCSPVSMFFIVMVPDPISDSPAMSTNFIPLRLA